ncbi:TonB-dependent receptor plug domain-containing protein [Eudoraea adriatica]|uniref:TonB-dependent receptor plug domain-containing protein n=1 Tax=Eudoraea adriatica TaxID=446681 RepID=UPI000379AED1|nr:TonB-dependent receptor plug domain-containing protein [Eudoraea adriatica]
MVKKHALFCVFCLLITTVSSQVEIDSMELQELDEVVVSDSRFPIKRENSGKTIIKISSEELENNQGKSVAEIINTRSSIEINGSRSRQGEVLGVFARGGRGRQVLILIDGIRVSDPSSFSQEYDLRLLAASNIESIEIIKGAASTLYGMSAATAVINIKSKKASDKKISGDFQSSIGTNQSSSDQNYNIAEFSNSATVSGSLESFTYSLGFSNVYTNGLSSIITEANEEDPFSRYNIDLKLGYSFKNKINLTVYANQTNLNSAYDESFGFIDAPYTFLTEQKRLGLSSKWKYKKGDLNLNGSFTNYKSDNRSAFPSMFEGNNYVIDLFNRYTFDERIYAILGVNYNLDRAEVDGIQEFSLIDPYANLVYVSPFGLNINAGMRLNVHSEYGTQIVYNLNPSYSIALDDGYLKFMGTYATSYITPSISQLFGMFGANPLLEPETNRTAEGGLEYKANNSLRLSALYFNRKEENFVFFDNTLFQYFNASNTINVQGLEGQLNWEPLKHMNLTANYTFTERKGDNAIRIPKHRIDATMGYNVSANSFLSLTYSFIGKRTDTDFNTSDDEVLDPFSTFSIYVSQEVMPNKLKFFLNLENVFNTTYTEVTGFTTRGRNVRLGISLKL